MSAISLKSITGITSITTPAGIDNQLTLHSNNTTERVKIDVAGNVHVNNHLSVTGIATASQGLRVPNGSATSNYISVGNNGALRFWGTTHQYADIRSGNLHFRNASLDNVLEIQQDKDIWMYGATYTLGAARFDSTVTIADSLIHFGDTDTKIRFPSNDQISFETAGVDRGRFDNDGNFLIGTTGHGNAGAGARHLVISGPSNQGLTINSTNTSGIYRDCNIYFGYGTSTSDMARGQFTYSGNGDYFHMSVGGTSYTLAKSFRLNSDGTVRFDSTPTGAHSMSLVIKSHKARAVDDNNGIVFRDANDHTQAVINVQKKSTSDATSDLVFRTSSGQVVNTLHGIPERLRITSTGLLSIGDNSNLDSQLTITQAQGDCIRLRSNATNNTFKYGIIKQEPYNNNALGVQIIGGKSDSGYSEVDIGGGIDGGYAATLIDFWTAANTTTATGTRRLRIDSGGGVRINNTRTTSTKLHVVGGTGSGTAYDVAVFAGGVNSTNGSGARIWLTGCENDPTARGTVIEGLMTDNANAHALIFKTSGSAAAPTERFRIDSNGVLKIERGSASNFALRIDTTSSTGACRISFDESGTSKGQLAYSHDNDRLEIVAQSGNAIAFYSGGNLVSQIDTNGHFLPQTNNVYDLGSSSKRWRNVYTTDLQLSNEGKTNDVDGTWGNYTIQEGESELFLINNRNGKKYKFNLTEVS